MDNQQIIFDQEILSKVSAPDTDTTRGIPQMVFIEDLKDFMSTNFALTAPGFEQCLKAINTLYIKYKGMEAKLLQQKKSMDGKITEVESTISTLTHINSTSGDEINTTFELSESAYVQATVTKPDVVLLWLGANVMVEYPREEATEMLTGNLATAKESYREISTHLNYVKDQITTCEVNISRLHNFRVELGIRSQPAQQQQ